MFSSIAVNAVYPAAVSQADYGNIQGTGDAEPSIEHGFQ